MPYPGIKPGSEKEKKMERCVQDVMRNKDIKEKYPDKKERKTVAIKICMSQIKGKKSKKVESKQEGGESEKRKNMAKKTVRKTVTEEVETSDDEQDEKVNDAEEKVEKAEEAEEEVEEDKVEKTDDEAVDEEVEETETAELEKTVKSLDGKINTLTEAITKLAQSQAPAEDAADDDEEPLEEETTKKVSDEEEEKADTSSGEASEIMKTLKALQAKVENLEKSPAQSKVRVNKSFSANDLNTDDVEGRLEKVEGRLSEIRKYRDQQPEAYSRNVKVQDEAFKLVDEKKALLEQKTNEEA